MNTYKFIITIEQYNPIIKDFELINVETEQEGYNVTEARNKIIELYKNEGEIIHSIQSVKQVDKYNYFPFCFKSIWNNIEKSHFTYTIYKGSKKLFRLQFDKELTDNELLQAIDTNINAKLIY